MAAKNMCNVVKGYLQHQRRVLYLQPQRADGTFPWAEADSRAREADIGLMLIDPPVQAGPSNSEVSTGGKRKKATDDNEPTSRRKTRLANTTQDEDSSYSATGKEASTSTKKGRPRGRPAETLRHPRRSIFVRGCIDTM